MKTLALMLLLASPVAAHCGDPGKGHAANATAVAVVLLMAVAGTAYATRKQW
jgi:hypothetical protein